MEQRKTTEVNRIASDLAAWGRVENKLAERYGPKIVYNRDFLKAKRDIYRHIRNKYNTKKLNIFEKAEMRVLRGQHRSLMRQIYPNPFVRLGRNLLVFSGNVAAITLRAIARLAKTFFSPKVSPQPLAPAKLATKPGNDAGNHPGNDKKQSENVKKTTQSQQAKTALSQARAIVRKMPAKARVQMPTTQGKGVRR